MALCQNSWQHAAGVPGTRRYVKSEASPRTWCLDFKECYVSDPRFIRPLQFPPTLDHVEDLPELAAEHAPLIASLALRGFSNLLFGLCGSTTASEVNPSHCDLEVLRAVAQSPLEPAAEFP